jgi:hypothetical protein
MVDVEPRRRGADRRRLLVSSALLARVHDLHRLAAAGFAAAALLGLCMVWTIIRTPGEL